MNFFKPDVWSGWHFFGSISLTFGFSALFPEWSNWVVGALAILCGIYYGKAWTISTTEALCKAKSTQNGWTQSGMLVEQMA